MNEYYVYVNVAILSNGGYIDYVWNTNLTELVFDNIDDAFTCYEYTEGILTDSYVSTIETYLKYRDCRMMVLVSLDDDEGNQLTWVGKIINKEC